MLCPAISPISENRGMVFWIVTSSAIGDSIADPHAIAGANRIWPLMPVPIQHDFSVDPDADDRPQPLLNLVTGNIAKINEDGRLVLKGGQCHSSPALPFVYKQKAN